jgi:hypothetical protein
MKFILMFLITINIFNNEKIVLKNIIIDTRETKSLEIKDAIVLESEQNILIQELKTFTKKNYLLNKNIKTQLLIKFQKAITKDQVEKMLKEKVEEYFYDKTFLIFGNLKEIIEYSNIYEFWVDFF